MLRPTVSRPVYLGVNPHLGPFTRILLLSDSCWFVDVGHLLSDERTGLSLQLPLTLGSAVILGYESRGTHDRTLLSQIRDSLNLEGQVPVFISPGTGWPSYTPRHWVPFLSPPTTRRATVEVFEHASAWTLSRSL
jgi:hypothetical protein